MDAGISNEETEQHLRRQAIEDISGCYHIPMDQVMSAYEWELALLSSAASVRCYLPILVRQRVKVLLDR